MPKLRVVTPEAGKMMKLAQIILQNRDGQFEMTNPIIDFGSTDFDLPDVGSMGRHAQGRIPLIDDNGEKFFMRLSAIKPSERGRWVIYRFEIYDATKEVVMSQKVNTIDLSKFMWAYSNCPQLGNRTDNNVPVYYGYRGSFNAVEVTLCKGAQVVGGEDDDFGDWAIYNVADVEKVEYESCTGSKVVIVRADDVFVVVETAEVGLTTYRRLREAGYEGVVGRREFTTLVCENGHTFEAEGDNPDIVWNENCPECSAFAAHTKEDAALLAKVNVWWQNEVGSYNFPVKDLRATNSGTYTVGDEEFASLRELLKSKQVPAGSIEGEGKIPVHTREEWETIMWPEGDWIDQLPARFFGR